jgi:hypothetical protein
VQKRRNVCELIVSTWNFARLRRVSLRDVGPLQYDTHPMTRKAAEPPSRRPARRRSVAPLVPPEKPKVVRKEPRRAPQTRLDSDFGICLCVVPAVRRRQDA